MICSGWGYLQMTAKYHCIKSGAADLRTTDLFKTAYRLEHIEKSGDLEGSMAVLEKLENELHRLGVYARGKYESTDCG